MFNVYTESATAGRFFGLNVDDLMLSTDPKSLFGEKAGLPFGRIRHLRLLEPADHKHQKQFDVSRTGICRPVQPCANLYACGNDRVLGPRPELQPAVPHDQPSSRPFPAWIPRPSTAPTRSGPRSPAPGGTCTGLPDNRPRRHRGQPRARAVRQIVGRPVPGPCRRSRCGARASGQSRAPAG